MNGGMRTSAGKPLYARLDAFSVSSLSPILMKMNSSHASSDGSHGANVLRAWEAQPQARVHARVYARVVRREIFARLRRGYRNRGPAGRPPDFLYAISTAASLTVLYRLQGGGG